jgi:hypothetical protein
MKKDILKKIYFNDVDDSNIKEFTVRFLSGWLLWIYIAVNPEINWSLIFEKLSKRNKSLFINEYNKAFLFTRIYRELTKLYLGKEIILKNIFFPHSAETFPEGFIKSNQPDDLRWKEVLEVIS